VNRLATPGHRTALIPTLGGETGHDLLADRGNFVIDLRQAGRTHSYLRGHEPQDTSASSLKRVVRRTLDVSLAVAALVATSPVFVAVVVASLFTPGPAFFSQERVGKQGKIFLCYKFRSMHTDAAERLQELLTTDEHFRSSWRNDQKVQQDPRITGLGRILRKTSLDELPQLINVLKGDMSVVGPRPVVPEETVRYGEVMPTVLSVRPGITGLWQVSGRNNLPYPERVQLDLRYVEEQSLMLDAKILAKTFTSVAGGNGAC